MESSSNNNELSKPYSNNNQSLEVNNESLETNCLTDKDYAKIIKKSTGDNHELLEVKWESLGGEIRGFTGHHRMLKLKIKTDAGDKVLSFFVKTLIGCSYNDDDIFKKEVFAYEFIENVNADVAPKMLHHGNQTIVLEDLCEKGYQGLVSKNFDKAHMLKALETLAKFHATSIVYEESKGSGYRMSKYHHEILKPRYCKDEETSGHRYVRSCWIGASAVIDLVFKGNPQKQFYKSKNDQMFHDFLNLLNTPNDYRKVFSHGDVWGNNLLFKHDSKGKPIDCKLIDFQLNRYTPPAHDVTMLIYMASERKLFHSHVHEYYNYYYQNLRTELQIVGLDITSILPKEEFQKTCKICMPISKYIWLFYSETMQASDAVNLKIANDSEFAKIAIFGDGRGDFVRENYELNPGYEKYMRLILEDFRLTHISEKMTLEDCCEVISEKLGGKLFEIVDYTVNKVVLKSGYLGDYFELKITVKTESTSTFDFFVKRTPDGNTHKQEVLSKTGASFKEMRFFSTIITDLESRGICTNFTPRSYISKPGFLILDNLKPLGYTLANIRESLDLDKVKLGLDAIAKLHSAGLILEEELGKAVRLNAMYPSELKESLYMEHPSSSDWLKAAILGAKEQARMYSNHTSVISLEEFMEFFENIYYNFDQLVKPSTKFRNTITHGDLWTNNLMYNSNDCKLIDFQFYRYAPPARDFLQFIHISTDREFRRNYLQICKEYYHSKLDCLLRKHNLNICDILSYPDFLESCEDERAFIVSQNLIYYQHLMTTPERAQEKLFEDVEYFQKAFLNDRSEFIRSTSEMDPVYRKRNQEAMKDLREYCEGIVEKKCELPFGFDEKYVSFLCNNV